MAFDDRSNNDLDDVLDDLSNIDVQELSVRGASLGDGADGASKDATDDELAPACPADTADSVEPVASVISVVALTWAT